MGVRKFCPTPVRGNGEKKLNRRKGAGFRVGQENRFFVYNGRWRLSASCFLNVVVWRFTETGRKGTGYNFWIPPKNHKRRPPTSLALLEGKAFFVVIFKLPLFRLKVFLKTYFSK